MISQAEIQSFRNIAISLREMNTAMKGYCNLPIHDLPAPPDAESELLSAAYSIEKLCDAVIELQGFKP